MVTLSIYLIIYIIGIFLCKWAATIIMDEMPDIYIFSKSTMVNIISWIPIINLVMGIIATKEILEDRFLTWRIKRTVKRKLNKIVKNHKGDEVAKELKKIIDQI